jgi:uncharacterized damage-inducible protein DinB
MMRRPEKNEYASYYDTYIKRICDTDIIRVLEEQTDKAVTFIKSIPEEKGAYRYAEGKWSVKDVLGHITDTERVFGYRALRFARGDSTEVPGFEQDDYVPAAKAWKRTMADLAEELYHLRKANLLMLKALGEEELSRGGIASKNYMSVRAAAYVLAGHLDHHINFLKERYLSEPNFISA